MMQHCDLHGCEIDRRGCPWCLIESLEQQLAAAHRAAEESAKDTHRRGWEQAKAEAQQALCEICCYNSADNPVPDECTTCNERRAITTMEYKEPTNEIL